MLCDIIYLNRDRKSRSQPLFGLSRNASLPQDNPVFAQNPFLKSIENTGYPTGIWEAMGSIPVGDSDFFFAPRSCHVE